MQDCVRCKNHSICRLEHRNLVEKCAFVNPTEETELEEYREIGTAEELKFIKQWKSDVVEDFCKYDASSIEELVGNVRNKAIDEFVDELVKEIADYSNCNMEAVLTQFDVIRIAEQMKGV